MGLAAIDPSCRFWAVFAVWLAAGETARANDVILVGKDRHSGKIIQMTAQEVTIDTTVRVETVATVKRETIPVNQITGIEFDGESTILGERAEVYRQGRLSRGRSRRREAQRRRFGSRRAEAGHRVLYRPGRHAARPVRPDGGR